MKIVNDIKVDKDRRIIVIDDLFPRSEQIRHFIWARNAPYINSNFDQPSDARITIDIHKKWLCMLSQEEMEDLGVVQVYASAIHKIFNKPIITVDRQYYNYSTFSTLDLTHVDNHDQHLDATRDYTVLQYANDHWKPEWYGETMFYDDKEENIIYTSLCKPGRVIIFDGKIPHSARPPSLLATVPRYTIATKIQIKEGE